MRFYKIIIITILVFGFMACIGNSKTATPLDTLKAYQIAVKKKDATTMKLLLSEGSLKIHQQEAQAQGLTLDDIVLRDTLFPGEQKVFGYRNEKVEGEKASIEVKNNFGSYDIIYLVLEDGLWKIDKKATSDQMFQDVNKPTNNLEDQINQDRQKIEDEMNNTTPTDPNATPSVSPENPSDTTIPDPNATETPNSTGTSPPPPPPPPVAPKPNPPSGQ